MIQKQTSNYEGTERRSRNQIPQGQQTTKASSLQLAKLAESVLQHNPEKINIRAEELARRPGHGIKLQPRRPPACRITSGRMRGVNPNSRKGTHGRTTSPSSSSNSASSALTSKHADT